MAAISNVILSPFVLALIGYVALVTVLTLIVQPLRLQMVAVAEEMLSEKHWNDDERRSINHLLDTCMSFKVGSFIVAATVSMVMDTLLRRPRVVAPSRVRLVKDRRFHVVVSNYVWSVFAINPIAVLISIPFTLVGTLLDACMGRPDIRSNMEEPVFRASAAVRSPHQPCLEPA